MTAVFVDFRSAFDTCPRDTVLTFLAEVGVPSNILRLLFCILQDNRIVIDDGVSLLPSFRQTTGYAQGDNLSPLLFSMLLKDLPGETYGVWQNVKIILYADDLLIYGRSPIHVQSALVRLSSAVRRLGLTVNSDKTVAMRFRNGGRVPGDASLTLDGKPIPYVNKFVYLGLYISFNARCFTWHIKDRCRKALLAAATIKKPQLLSVRTAMQLFDIKVLPTATFAVELIWEHLTAENLECLDKCKASFIKRVLGLHRSAKNRLVYLLADTTRPTDDILRRFSLCETPAYRKTVEKWEQKKTEIDPNFFHTPAMLDSAWKKSCRTNRHVLTRFSVHGFHHILCSRKGWHQPDSACVCSRCGHPCSLYHATDCPRVTSLGSLAAVLTDR